MSSPPGRTVATPDYTGRATPPTAVVLVAYNSGPALRACVAALLESAEPPLITIIDNASRDDALRQVARRFAAELEQGQLRALPLRRNLGFAAAVNLAVSRLPAEVSTVITLNPDTQPPADFAARLAQPLAQQPELGGVGAILTFQTAPDVIASAGVDLHRNGVAIDRLLGQPTQPDDAALQPVAGISGGAAAWRRSAFDAAGGFAAPFFMYLEDVDLSLRLRLAGWELAVRGDVLVPHAYSASAGEGSPFKRRLLSRNRWWTLLRTWPDELLRRDRASMLGFDALVAGHAAATLDLATVRGRAEALARTPWRLRERNDIQRERVLSNEGFDRWVQPALSPRTLLRLRRLTRELALSPVANTPGSAALRTLEDAGHEPS